MRDVFSCRCNRSTSSINSFFESRSKSERFISSMDSEINAADKGVGSYTNRENRESVKLEFAPTLIN